MKRRVRRVWGADERDGGFKGWPNNDDIEMESERGRIQVKEIYESNCWRQPPNVYLMGKFVFRNIQIVTFLWWSDSGLEVEFVLEYSIAENINLLSV